jgi:2-polyprenyl-3-methyl-5-hydroxy-6-metoxy-1,4-benzoquinol methylase
MNIDYSRHYLKWHSDSPEHIYNMKIYYKKLLTPYILQDKNSYILDVGGGMGFSLMPLKDMGFKNIECVDIDSKKIQSCLNKKLNVTLVEDSIQYLSKKENAYEMILAFDVIEQVPHQYQLEFVTTIQKAIKSNGILICTVPNANSTLASRWRYIDWTRYISFTEHSLDFRLYNAGFKNIRIFETEFFQAPRFSSLFCHLILTKWLLGYIIHWFCFRSVRAL